jgi:hypothetical protein
MQNFCVTLGGLENVWSCIDPWFFHSTSEDGKVEKCFFARLSCTLPDWKLREKRNTTNTNNFALYVKSQIWVILSIGND